MAKRRLGDAVRRLRLARGLTQEALAGRAATTQRRVSMIESGREGASGVMLLRLARALDADLRLTARHSGNDIDAMTPAA